MPDVIKLGLVRVCTLGRHPAAMFFFSCVIVSVLNTAVAPAPTMSEDPKVNKLYEFQAATKNLFTITCTTTPPTSGCVVSIEAMLPTSPPCSKCFAIYPCNTGDFCLHYVAGQGSLNAEEEDQYIFTLTGTDVVSKEVSRVYVDVRITTNSPPYFNYASMSTDVEVSNAKTQPLGYIIHSVDAEDDEGDPLSYSMTLQPNVEGIEMDTLSGTIRTTKALKSVCINEFVAMVTVDDGHNDPVGPFQVNIGLDDANDPPYVNNLDGELYVREDEPVDSTVLTLAAFDSGQSASVVYTVITTPLSATNIFQIEGNELKLKEALDYETGPQLVSMTIQADDGSCVSKLYTLKIFITNVNEPPVISPVDQTLDACEGLVTVVPSWDVSDPDTGDSILFIAVEPNADGYFKINKNTGAISTVLDYDLDNNNKKKASEVLTVTLRDQQLFTVSVTVTIRFSDCNDNYPIFDRPAVSFGVSECDPVGTPVAKLDGYASDADSDYQQNNLLTFQGAGTGATVELAGQLLLTATFTAGQVSTFPVYASDQGQTPGSKTSLSPLWVSLYGERCVTQPPPATTTTIAPLDASSFNNSTGFGSANREWLIAAVVLGALLLILLSYMMCMYGWPGIARPSPSQLSPVGRSRPPPQPPESFQSRPPARRPDLPSDEPSEDLDDRDSGWSTGSYEGNANTPQQANDISNQQASPPFDGFWKESYANDDITGVPNRDAVPEPCKTIVPPPKITSPTNILPIIPVSPQAGPTPEKI